MNETIKSLTDIATSTNGLSEAEKATLRDAAKSIDKTLSIADGKIQRLEKDKNALSVLLQETIDELEQKGQP